MVRAPTLGYESVYGPPLTVSLISIKPRMCVYLTCCGSAYADGWRTAGSAPNEF